MLDSMEKDRADREADKKPRGRTIDKVDWWCELAARREDELGLTHVQLAKDVSTDDWIVGETNVLRCIDGSVLNLKLAQAISARLGIVPPAFIPSSEDEAISIFAAIELRKIRLQLLVMRAGVEARGAQRQPEPLPSPPHGHPRRKRRRAHRVP